MSQPDPSRQHPHVPYVLGPPQYPVSGPPGPHPYPPPYVVPVLRQETDSDRRLKRAGSVALWVWDRARRAADRPDRRVPAAVLRRGDHGRRGGPDTDSLIIFRGGVGGSPPE